MLRWRHLTALVCISALPLFSSASTPAPDQKAVLVTGASTGIGRKITEVFASQGHFVYAGARKQKDMDARTHWTM